MAAFDVTTETKSKGIWIIRSAPRHASNAAINNKNIAPNATAIAQIV